MMNTNSTGKKLTGYPSVDKPWLKYYSEDAPRYVSEHTGQNIYQYIKSMNCQHMDYIAIEYFGIKITYNELFKKINVVAKSLRALGISKGDYITVCLPNIPEIVYFIYAINQIGGVACLIDPRTNADGILERANEAGAKLLVTVTDIVESKINPIQEELVAKNIIAVSPADSIYIKSLKSAAIKTIYATKRIKCNSDKLIRYKSFIRNGNKWDGYLDDIFIENSPAIIVYTSGTTGSAKGVILSNEAIIASRRMIEYGSANVEGNASFLGVIPFFVAYGALTGMNNSLCCGWKIILIPKFNPKQFGELILKHKAVSALGVPRFWCDFANQNVDKDISFLKNPICGGDKISPISVNKVNHYLQEHGACCLKIGYGASEFGGGIAITSRNAYVENSTGVILPGVIGMVINPDTGDELAYNEEGEICFYSPTMMTGYFNSEDETNQITIFRNGIKYYRTGDKGHIDENGCVYIVDRYKRVMMRPDGHTVHATPIENAIMEHELVEACAVVGISIDDYPGVIPTAFIKIRCLEREINALINEIDSICSKKIPERDKAYAYVILESLPYTLMGKIDYKALERYSFAELDYVVKDCSFLH